ncbi:hypothetical protein FA95DRAFT_607452 [Auriscalpium vulgare]|uniref:Uncharacterized protein n=1 Tax=Auriscalpium vulgare TaxID=40419 RepID=A0ACB8REB9_9AGAM|nr:hypothetical protein FA95DRAFT_607452 [Auriscalpium vulgare]
MSNSQRRAATRRGAEARGLDLDLRAKGERCGAHVVRPPPDPTAIPSPNPTCTRTTQHPGHTVHAGVQRRRSNDPARQVPLRPRQVLCPMRRQRRAPPLPSAAQFFDPRRPGRRSTTLKTYRREIETSQTSRKFLRRWPNRHGYSRS